MPAKRKPLSDQPRPELLPEDLRSGGAALTAFDRATLDTTRRFSPSMVHAILTDAASGDPLHVHELHNAMIRSWPRLAKCIRQVRKAASSAPWTWQAWTDPDGDTPPEAQARLRTVERAWRIWQPEPGTLEKDWGGMVEHFAECELRGIGVGEMLWHTMDDGAGVLNAPRAVRPTHPYYFAWPLHNGETGGSGGDQLLFRPGGQRSGRNLTPWPERQFLVQLSESWFDHPALSGLLGVLAPWWIAANYGPQWLMNYAQLFGQPTRVGKYPAGDVNARNALASMLANLGAAGWAAIPDNCSLDLVAAAAAAATLPQALIIELADKICDITLLGQSLTTDTGGVGSQALGNVHEGVRLETLRGILAPVARTLSAQYAPAVLALNHGDDRWCPSITHGLADPEDEKAKAERDEILMRSGMQMGRAFFYQRHNVPMPEGDEPVIAPAAAAARNGEVGSVKSKRADMPKAAQAELAAVMEQTLLEAVRMGFEAAGDDLKEDA